MGLNRAEAMFARGQYLVRPELPNRIGVEGAGVVTALGEGVSDVAVGARVGILAATDMTRYGTGAEKVVLPRSALLPDVPGQGDLELAAFWMAYLTAYGGMVQTGRLAEGETVLISAASSSVGLAAIELAKHVGARAVATTRGPAKRDRLLEAGADRVIVTDQASVADAGERFDLVFDAVAGPFAAEAGSALAPGGRLVVYGALAGAEVTPFPLRAAFAREVTMTAFHLGFHVMQVEARRADALRWLTEHAAKAPLRPIIDRTFPFDQLADAYRHLEASEQFGKVVVRVAA
ncbi:MAG: zinc-dependent alcohol dehydrogenase family protein [Sandaracinaceae bacterium]